MSGTHQSDDGKQSLAVFISHSSRDHELAAAVTELLRSALGLAPADIRCTSVDGYRLPAGADVDYELRADVLSAHVFIGLVSASSMASAYVLFELGIRWGASHSLIPLLAPGADPGLLRGPLARLNALDCASESQLHQLVSEVGAELGARPNESFSYRREIKRVIAAKEPASTDSEDAIQLNEVGRKFDRGRALVMLASFRDGRTRSSLLAESLGWSVAKTEETLADLQLHGFVKNLIDDLWAVTPIGSTFLAETPVL